VAGLPIPEVSRGLGHTSSQVTRGSHGRLLPGPGEHVVAMCSTS
jgi:hypothetical protein